MGDLDFERVLRIEFDAKEGSFLLKLRTELVWDKPRFSRLVVAMEECAKSCATEELLPRWIANGFWYLDAFVQEWSSHPSFPREHEPEYYEAAYERLHDLAYWLFFGESPSLAPLPTL